MRPIIQSVKHYLQYTLSNEAAGTIGQRTLVDAVNVTAANLAQEVPEGAVVKAVYVELWIASDDAAAGSFEISVERQSGVPGLMTYAESLALNDYTNKKNILYNTMGLIATNVANPTPILRQWFKIPKGKQRFGLGDKLILNISSISNGLNYCGFVTYKHYQ